MTLSCGTTSCAATGAETIGSRGCSISLSLSELVEEPEGCVHSERESYSYSVESVETPVRSNTYKGEHSLSTYSVLTQSDIP